jgi:hypothetical protein
MATTTAAIRVNSPAMVAVGAMPESNAVRAESSSRSATSAGRVWATAVAPPMLSAASPASVGGRPCGTSTFAR